MLKKKNTESIVERETESDGSVCVSGRRTEESPSPGDFVLFTIHSSPSAFSSRRDLLGKRNHGVAAYSPFLFPAAPHHQIRACSSAANRSVPATVRRNFTPPSIPSRNKMTHVAAASRAHFFILTKPTRAAFALQSFQLFNLVSTACTMDRSEGKDRLIVPLISRSDPVNMKWYLLRSDQTQDSKTQDRQSLVFMKFTSRALVKNSPSRTSKCSMFSSPDELYLHLLHQACSGVSFGQSCFSRGRDRYGSVLSITVNTMFLSVFRTDCLISLRSDGGVPASIFSYAPFYGIPTRRYFPNVFRHLYRFIAVLLTGYLVKVFTGTVGASYFVFAPSNLLFWRSTVLQRYILRSAALGGREGTLIDHLGFRPIPSLLQKSISSAIGLYIGFKLF